MKNKTDDDAIYDAYLPQTAVTQHMADLTRAYAEEKYRGNLGALIRDAVRQLLASAYVPEASPEEWSDALE